MELEAIRKRSAADVVFSSLHDRIVAGELKPGDRLPPQDELARQLNVSRNTLREAIHKLTVMGFLTAKPGVGTVVQVSNPASYLGSLGDHLLMDPTTVREFVEARLFVEKATVRLAVLRATPEVIAELETIVDGQVRAYEAGDTAGFSLLDASFHMLLAKSSDNHVLVKFLETLWDLLHQFILEVASLPSAVENALEYHHHILTCLAKRDPQGAEAALVSHLHNVVCNIESSLNLDLEMDQLFELEMRSPSQSAPPKRRKRRS